MNALSHHFRPLGGTGLRCCPIGFGCYRVVESNPTHEAALREYLERGGNLIDTSANYGDGHSESLVGKVLPDGSGEPVILVTKGGYIQGENFSLAQRRHFPEVVEYAEGLWHSIHPDFLETQIQRSRERLRREAIDVYLLHNPEYYLEEVAHRKPVGKEDHEEFYRRIGEAFRYLEGQVAAGWIRWYGISSNNFPLPASSPTLTSVRRCWEVAEAISSSHHFRVVQLPLNLYENGGALEPNNDGKTVLEFCHEKGIGVLLNRPLNAIFGNQMLRLADFLRPGERPPGKEALLAILEPVRAMERELEQNLGIPLLYGEQKGVAGYLEWIVPQIHSPAQWEQAFYQYIFLPVERWATECQQLYGGSREWEGWWKKFAPSLPGVLREVERYQAASQQGTSDAIRSRLQQAGYPDAKHSLSQMAHTVLLSLEGASCVLNGMRRPEYVADSLGALALPAVNARRVLTRFRHRND